MIAALQIINNATKAGITSIPVTKHFPATMFWASNFELQIPKIPKIPSYHVLGIQGANHHRAAMPVFTQGSVEHRLSICYKWAAEPKQCEVEEKVRKLSHKY